MSHRDVANCKVTLRNCCCALLQNGRDAINRHTLWGMVSYFFFLLFVMPASMAGIKEVVLLCVVGVVWVLVEHSRAEHLAKPKLSWLLTVCATLYFGFSFYWRWMQSSKVRSIAARLQVPPMVVVLAAAVVLSIASLYFVYRLTQRTWHLFTDVDGAHPLRRRLAYMGITSMATVACVQVMAQADALSMGMLKALVGGLIVWVIVVCFYCLTKSVPASILVGTGLFMIISTINAYVYIFRARMFTPLDIFTIGTVKNVVDSYSFFPIPLNIVIGWILWLAVVGCMIWKCSGLPKCVTFGWKQRLSLWLGCFLVALVCVGYTMNVKTYHWQNEGALFNGYVVDFVSQFKEVRVKKPTGYSEQAIAELENRYTVSGDTGTNEEDPPHIIVIMDEAFSDLNVIGNVETDVEVTPFISSLKENTVYGNTLVSVYGGNTANSEFEFLTGNSMAWFSQNTIPYQQYIKSPTYSMVSDLTTRYDYDCVSMHPYLSDGWNRVAVYEHLGFKDSLFLEDFPQEQYIREYISDREMFQKIVEMYENRGNNPLFLFGVSMQNHGGYSYVGDNYTQGVSYVGENDYPRVDQYLSLIHETDKAVEYLISYFSAVDEKVVVVFFGDHQPKLDDAFYADVLGHDFDTLDDQQKKYTVPFFVWTNYDTVEKQVECTGLNYLSSYVYEAAGLTPPAYNRFLTEMEKVIPSINANGFYSVAQQAYLPFDEASEEEKVWLDAYRMLQYNGLFDAQNGSKTFFQPLNDPQP